MKRRPNFHSIVRNVLKRHPGIPAMLGLLFLLQFDVENFFTLKLGVGVPITGMPKQGESNKDSARESRAEQSRKKEVLQTVDCASLALTKKTTWAYHWNFGLLQQVCKDNYCPIEKSQSKTLMGWLNF